MATRYEFITSIDHTNKNWVVRGTILEILATLTRKDGRRIRKYIIVDSSGNEVVGTILENQVHQALPRIQPFDVFDIYNARVVATHRPYAIIDSSTEWIITERTVLNKVDNANPNILPLFNQLTPLKDVFFKHEEEDQLENIMGVIIKVDVPCRQIYSRKTRQIQNFTIIDNGNRPLKIMLVDNFLEEFGPVLMAAMQNRMVIISRRIKVNENGTLLGTITTSFTANAPGPSTEWLHSWYHAHHEAMLPIWLRNNA